MKKFITISFTTLLLGLVVCFFIYRAMNVAPDATLSKAEQMQTILETSGCIACHTTDAELPFYGNWPIAGNMVKADIEKGVKYFDMTGVLEQLSDAKTMGEVALVRTYDAISDGTMPPFKYNIMHWGAAISEEELAIVADWTKEQYAVHYATGLASAAMANEFVQPLPDAEPVDSLKYELGRILFHDVRLSSDNTISCASCHELTTAGVDNKPFSEGVDGQFGGINAPTVFNAVHNFVQFWDGRAQTLADQAAGPPLNPIEMACKDWDEIIVKLQADDTLTQMFLAAYPEGYNDKSITDAIQEFEKTLVTPNSRFDKYLKGDATALAQNEIEGYELFKSYNCINCHVGANMGGQSYEKMGLEQDYFAARTADVSELTAQEDFGRHKETKLEKDINKFKVPSLRNIALTYPYFHDATVETLEEAVRQMVQYQHETMATQEEIDKMVAFLQTLTGEYEGVLLTNTNPGVVK